jgi:hypothetical protein
MTSRFCSAQPDAATLCTLKADIAAVFGDVEAMLWPHEVQAVQRWLKAERQQWRWLERCEAEAFNSLNAWLLGQASAARAFQRKQGSLEL